MGALVWRRGTYIDGNGCGVVAAWHMRKVFQYLYSNYLQLMECEGGRIDGGGRGCRCIKIFT